MPKAAAPRRVAIVGSGISGLGAAWLLKRAGWHVTVYESEETCGGHTLTDETEAGAPVDLGFQVFNFTNYPNLSALFEELGIDSCQSDMSFSVSKDGGRMEWGSHGLDSVFCQRSNLCSPRFLRMMADMVRFNRKAKQVLQAQQSFRGVSLQMFLDNGWYSEAFRSDYLLPMCAAIWSVPNSQCLQFPIATVVAFLNNHHMLDIVARPQWRVVKDRSQKYVERILTELDVVKTSCAVTGLERGAAKTVVRDAKGGAESFDHVVLATHTDVSLKILGAGASAEEKAVLGGIPYEANDIYLHKDATLMPRERKAWASWNVLSEGGAGADEQAVCVTYWCNLLQNFDRDTGDRFVTLNPRRVPAKGTVIRRLSLSHPKFGFESRAAQEALPTIQGGKNTWFCGAWAGWGFHEDGLNSGIAVASALGAPPPWTPRPLSPKVPMMHGLAIKGFERLAHKAITLGHLRVLLPNGTELSFGTPPAERTLDPYSAKDQSVRMRVFDTAFFGRVLRDQDIGLGEAFMENMYDVDDLTRLLTLCTLNLSNIVQETNGSLRAKAGGWLQSLRHASRSNTMEGSRRNINEHYDLGNIMYEQFLDETMTYSAAKFDTPEDTLQQAQLNKYDAIIKDCGISKEHHVLECGCGWGSFAVRAASTVGCRVTGITISEEQFLDARKRVEAAGVSHLVEITFCDYRELPSRFGEDSFDRVVSVEMIEAVGHEHLPQYFATLGRILKPQGQMTIQVITSQDAFYHQQFQSSDFIKRHIFPGSVIPCLRVMREAAAAAGLSEHAQMRDIGPDYAVTLRMWHEAWCAKRDSLRELGVDDVFFRKWRFYFSFCEAAFGTGYLSDYHITWTKQAARPLAGTASAAAAAGAVATASIASSPAAMTHTRLQLPDLTLLMAWVFLCGVAVGRKDSLWRIPASTMACFLLKAFSRAAFARPDAFHEAVVGLVYAASVSSVGVSALLRSHSGPGGRGSAGLDLLHGECTMCEYACAICCGYCLHRLFCACAFPGRASWGLAELLRSAVLLTCIASSLFGHLVLPYVTLCLVAELHTVVASAHTLLRAASSCSKGRALRLLALLELGSVLCFRLVFQVALTAKVWHDDALRGANGGAVFAIAMVGMLVLDGLALRDSAACALSYLAGSEDDNDVIDVTKFESTAAKEAELLGQLDAERSGKVRRACAANKILQGAPTEGKKKKAQ